MNFILEKLKNIVKRGYITKSLDDDTTIPVSQVSYLGKIGYTERVSPYGLYCNYPAGIQTITFSILGHDSNRASIAYSQGDRFKNLKAGEVLLGNPQTQSFIKLDNNGNIIIDSKANVIINSAEKVTIAATTEVDITATTNINITAIVDVKLQSLAKLTIDSGAEIDINSVGAINVAGGDINITNGTINVTGDAEMNADNIKLNANKIDLGSGGPAIARVGDSVAVSLVSGVGTITSGGTNTSI